MRVATGGGCNDSASLKRLNKDYKSSEYHYVSSDTAPHADICKQIKDAGMIPVYDIELAVWVNSGFNVGYDINFMRPALQAIKDAGWQAFSSEGVSQKQVSILREYLPYINYGGERGENVYAEGSMYYRPRSMADGNYLETYHKESTNEYHAALKSAALSTPDNMGVTLMLYTNASLEMDNVAMGNFIQAAIDGGVKINTVLFWCGVVNCPTEGLDGPFNSLYHYLDNRFGFALDSEIPPIVGNGDEEIKIMTEPIAIVFNDTIYAFVVGLDKSLWYRSRAPDAAYWTAWRSLGGKMNTEPSISVTSKMLYVLAKGTDKALYTISMDKDGVWSAWESLGGGIL